MVGNLRGAKGLTMCAAFCHHQSMVSVFIQHLLAVLGYHLG